MPISSVRAFLWQQLSLKEHTPESHVSRAYHNQREIRCFWSPVSHTGLNKDHCQPDHLAKTVPCPGMGLFAHRGFMASQVEKKTKFLLSCTIK